MASPDLTVALSAVLGTAFGAFMIAYPGVVLQVQTAGTRPDRQPGPAGGDAPNDGDGWENIVRVMGAVFLVGGLYFASRFVV